MKLKQRSVVLVVVILLSTIVLSGFLNISVINETRDNEDMNDVSTKLFVRPIELSTALPLAYYNFESKLERKDLEILFHPPKQSFKRGGAGTDSAETIDESTVEDTMNFRKKRLQERCREVQNIIDEQIKSYNNTYSHGRYLVSANNGVYTCAPFKVAMSNWKMMMFVLAGFLNTTDPLYLDLEKNNGQGIMKTEFLIYRRRPPPRDRMKRYREVDFKQAQLMKISKLGSWISYRHPFERLVSAYRSRVVESRFLRIKVLNMRPRNWKKFPSKYPPLPTFSEFVDFVIFMLRPSKSRYGEAHIVPIHEYCRVCHMDFKYLIAYEKINEEANFVLRRLKIDDKASFGTRASAYQAKTVKTKLNKNYKAVNSTNSLVSGYFEQLSTVQIWKLFRIYQLDFYLFGYTSELIATDD